MFVPAKRANVGFSAFVLFEGCRTLWTPKGASLDVAFPGPANLRIGVLDLVHPPRTPHSSHTHRTDAGFFDLVAMLSSALFAPRCCRTGPNPPGAPCSTQTHRANVGSLAAISSARTSLFGGQKNRRDERRNRKFVQGSI
jgi:hypothetical protein